MLACYSRRVLRVILYGLDIVSAISSRLVEEYGSGEVYMSKSEAGDAAAHDHATQEMIDRIVTENAGLLERLRDA